MSGMMVVVLLLFVVWVVKTGLESRPTDNGINTLRECQWSKKKPFVFPTAIFFLTTWLLFPTQSSCKYILGLYFTLDWDGEWTVMGLGWEVLRWLYRQAGELEGVLDCLDCFYFVRDSNGWSGLGDNVAMVMLMPR